MKVVQLRLYPHDHYYKFGWSFDYNRPWSEPGREHGGSKFWIILKWHGPLENKLVPLPFSQELVKDRTRLNVLTT